jgi:hypothetical protein
MIIRDVHPCLKETFFRDQITYFTIPFAANQNDDTL